MSRPFHLAYFSDGFIAPAWNTRWEGATSKTWASDPSFYVEVARALERAKFDFLILADASYVPQSYGGSSETSLKVARSVPIHDPSVLMPVLATNTSRIGFAPTLTTTEWRPYQLARYMATIDHLSKGRSAWNIVTGSNHLAAQNYGFDGQPGHDERYDMADEFVEIAKRLWASWEPDAVVMDRARGYYVDHTKVHTIDYVGKYFSSRGPAVTMPSPQGRPTLLQAGASPRGRTFAARHADVVLAHAETVDGFKRYRKEVHAKANEIGRDPDTLRLFFSMRPILGDTDELAREKAKHYDAENEQLFETRVSIFSQHWMMDLSKLDANEPLPPDLTTNGHLGLLDEAIASGKTLRELLGGVPRRDDDLDFVGSPETVASQIAEFVDETGGDGLMITQWGTLDRRFIAEVADGLVPVLQRRGLVRSEYSGETLREHLFEF